MGWLLIPFHQSVIWRGKVGFWGFFWRGSDKLWLKQMVISGRSPGSAGRLAIPAVANHLDCWSSAFQLFWGVCVCVCVRWGAECIDISPYIQMTLKVLPNERRMAKEVVGGDEDWNQHPANVIWVVLYGGQWGLMADGVWTPQPTGEFESASMLTVFYM